MAGRPPFEPTEEQRKIVEILVGMGLPHEQICQIVRKPNGKPIDPKTLRRHFRAEIDAGAVKLKAKVGQFMVATIFGLETPEGVVRIEKEECRAALLQLFLKSQCGFTDRQTQEGNPDKPMFVYQANKTDSKL